MGSVNSAPSMPPPPVPYPSTAVATAYSCSTSTSSSSSCSMPKRIKKWRKLSGGFGLGSLAASSSRRRHRGDQQRWEASKSVELLLYPGSLGLVNWTSSSLPHLPWFTHQPLTHSHVHTCMPRSRDDTQGDDRTIRAGEIAHQRR